MTARTILDRDNVANYLRSQDVLGGSSRIDAEPLGGGVSNTVLRITQDDDCMVVKQPLADLAVEEEWLADLERVHNEATAARAYRTVLADNNLPGVAVPAVIFEDKDNHVLGIECAPSDAETWKSRLLNRDVDTRIAGLLGLFLGTSHAATAGDTALARRFSSNAPFRQLRLDPYHRTVARRHEDVAPAIHKETARISTVERTLVHGDFSPKNVLVFDNGNDPDLWILDFEVAHWGDPSFDVAFMLNHILLKSVVLPRHRSTLLTAAREFFAQYNETVPWVIEPNTVRELSILMLARVDGKSPVEYITDSRTKETLRSVVKTAIQSEVETLDRFIELLQEGVGQ